MPFFSNNYFYYITIALQLICVLHCVRKGNQQKWIWIIVFIPIVGCIVYIVTEMFTGREMEQVQSGIGNLINPSGSIRKLEENLRFSDTFNNRMALADAYLASGNTDQAIALYEGSYTGAFTENEQLLKQLVIAYYIKQRYSDAIKMAQKMYNTPQFARSKVHILYAMSLDQAGNYEQAEKEFKLMNVRYSHFEARYQYGLFLQRAGRAQEAYELFANMVDEGAHLSSREKSASREWLAKAREAMRNAERGVKL
ncbi:MAG: PLDc N-terminal domain-containing protein [Chitinophagaceae bacterium]